jgi:hypothetical protein
MKTKLRIDDPIFLLNNKEIRCMLYMIPGRNGSTQIHVSVGIQKPNYPQVMQYQRPAPPLRIHHHARENNPIQPAPP